MDNWFQYFTERYAEFGYPVLFVGVLLENAGIPVPGETAVLVGGFLASPAGGGHFHIAWIIVLTLLAAVLGDNLGFWLGHRWARPRLQSGRRFLFLTPGALQLAEGYFARYGLWTIFFARFITGLRVVGALAAGTAGMPWRRFLVANAAGALIWAVTISLLGYFFGHSWELLHKVLGRGGMLILGSVIVLVGLPYVLRRLHRLSPTLWERLPRRQVVLGLLAAVLEVICLALLFLISEGRQPTEYDAAVRGWLAARKPAPLLDVLAVVGSFSGIVPVVILVTAVTVGWLLRLGRSGREVIAACWALLASEALGLLVFELLRVRHIDPARAATWPFGFAGLIPLRAFAVLGMTAYLIRRQDRRWGHIAEALAGVFVLLAGFGVLWTERQIMTKALLEYAAGGLVLFAGIWWLEGYGPGLRPVPVHDES